ncbi:MAG TPA: transglutaminase-like domain-containing protein [Polyangium sp.]|nr:transglutaminase-like domain-containing protein [Polyangium sp.]
MSFYRGTLEVNAITVVAHVDDSKREADISVEVEHQNPGFGPMHAELSATLPGLATMSIRAKDAPKPLRTALSLVKKSVSGRLGGQQFAVNRKVVGSQLKAKESLIADLRYLTTVRGNETKSLTLVPTFEVDGQYYAHKVTIQTVTVQLPANAKHIVTSSLTPSKITPGPNGMLVEFQVKNAVPMPLTLKWTEVDASIRVLKSSRVLPNRKIEVTIDVQNMGQSAATFKVIDEYSNAQLASFAPAANFTVVSVGDRESRTTFQSTVSLGPTKSAKLTYTVEPHGDVLSIPTTRVTVNDVPVATSGKPSIVHVGGLATILNPQVVAVPSGFSFDYVSDDHHLKQCGLTCGGQTYDKVHERLQFTDSVVFADINGDDDYRWSAMHHVLRFQNAFTAHEMTPWLAKTHNVTTHDGYFRHEGLRQFSCAVVVPTAWEFNFTNDDHHINKMAFEIETGAFDRTQGEIHWKTRVTYADKNFDDPYNYRYGYVILGFNGTAFQRVYSAPDDGGSAMAIEQFPAQELRNYPRAIVVPAGWSFDFNGDDHQVNIVSFGIRNVTFDKMQGRVQWQAHADFRDKNGDDDYTWGYRVLILGTSDGEQREHESGITTDNGGASSRPFNIDLNGLFVPITWTNGIQDGDETGVDCGGSSPAADLQPLGTAVNPGKGASSHLYSLRDEDEQRVVRTFANAALVEYADAQGQDHRTYYTGVTVADRHVEAIAWYVNRHMEYVSDGLFDGSQSAYDTITSSGHRGSLDFAGDCEDHAILRAALLRSLGFKPTAIFCADHHNSVDQGQDNECYGDKKGSGGHTYNVVIYRGKYRIMDYGPMQTRRWANKSCWNQHVTDNIWNDHTGEHWSQRDTSPFGTTPLVNYPGNPCSPSTTWDWRTYFNDITP